MNKSDLLFSQVSNDEDIFKCQTYLFKLADLMQEHRVNNCPALMLPFEFCHVAVIDTKNNIQSVIVEQETENTLNCRAYYAENKFFEFIFGRIKKEDETREYEASITYSCLSEEEEKKIKALEINMESVIHSAVDRIAMFLEMIKEGYALKLKANEDFKIFRKNSFLKMKKPILVSRFNGTYICQAYKYYKDLITYDLKGTMPKIIENPWEKAKESHIEKYGNPNEGTGVKNED